MIRGFYMFLPRKWRNGPGEEVFIETKRVNRTPKFAAEILRQLSVPATPENIKEAIWRLEYGECEVVDYGKFGQWYNIRGENYGGCGNPLDSGKTVILKIA